MSTPAANLAFGAFFAAAIAGALIVVNATNISFWRYVLAVAGVATFIYAGLTGKTQPK